jgi:H/ACA ribonucleoprotein complex subunit 2
VCNLFASSEINNHQLIYFFDFIGETGFCIIAGDISPIDVITHLPIMCEDRQIPYFYVPSKIDLGAAACTKRPTSCILISPKDSFGEKELFDKLCSEALSCASSI